MCCCLLLILPVAATFIVGAAIVATQTPLAAALANPAMLAMASSMGWVSVVLSTAAVIGTSGLIALYSFATADADLSLLLRGKHKPGVFKGKVVWVTGASQGLGATVARYLAAQGAKVIVSARSEDKLQRTRACCPKPNDVLVLPFDLMDSAERLQAAAKAADQAFGGAGVDFLIHNAGASQHALAAETTDEVAEKLLDINTLAPIRLTHAALPFMLKRGKGRFVVVSSMAAKVPSPGQAVYSAAKMAVWGYFASLATELADKGISVTIVCPGPVAPPVGEVSTRSLYGPNGPIQRHEVPDSKRMPASRAAVLIANAMAAGVAECWLAKQPVLLMAYLMQYVPQLGLAVMKQIGPKRARALSSGQSGYNVGAFLKAGSSGSH